MERTAPRSSLDPAPDTNGRAAEDPAPAPRTLTRIEQMPREIGVLLLATGMVTGMLPPPPGPFDLSLILAGGVALWPRGFRTLRGWTQRRFPRAHHAGMSFLNRFLEDLERRYPGATHPTENEQPTVLQILDEILEDRAWGDPGATRGGAPPVDSVMTPWLDRVRDGNAGRTEADGDSVQRLANRQF
jgi:hypothetical protein